MKRVLLLLLLSVFTMTAYAQINFGPRIAITQDQLSIDNASNGSVESLGTTTGYQVGVFMRVQIPVLGLSLQPELLYTQSEVGFQLNSLSYDLDIDAFELPVMIGYKLGPVRLQAGPSFGFITEITRTQPNGTVFFVQNSYETFSLGYQAGAGIDLKKFVLDVKYGGDLNRIGTNLDLGQRGDQRQNQFILALGYKIF